MAELKPCPFCGSENIQYLIEGHFQPWEGDGLLLWYRCACNGCGAEMDTGGCRTMIDAAREWNKRADT